MSGLDLFAFERDLQSVADNMRRTYNAAHPFTPPVFNPTPMTAEQERLDRQYAEALRRG